MLDSHDPEDFKPSSCGSIAVLPSAGGSCCLLLAEPEFYPALDLTMKLLAGHVRLLPAAVRNHALVSLGSVVDDGQDDFEVAMGAASDGQHGSRLRVISRPNLGKRGLYTYRRSPSLLVRSRGPFVSLKDSGWLIGPLPFESESLVAARIRCVCFTDFT